MTTNTILEAYQKRAQKTALYPADKAVEYLVLGLCGEAGELAEKIQLETPVGDMLAELGDVCWYLAMLSYTLDLPIGKVFPQVLPANPNKALLDLLANSGAFANKHKKVLRGDGKTVKDNLSAYNQYLVACWNGVATLAKLWGSTYESVCQANADKLESRHLRGVIRGSGDTR